MDESNGHPFDQLKPDVILDAVESRGFLADGRLLELNSYENRVYQVGLDEATPLIAKFYRPGRWSDAQIDEEHELARELAEQGVPVVAPLSGEDGASLFHHAGFRVALFPRRGGHPPELDNMDHLHVLGRYLGIFHNVGAARGFRERPTLDVQSFGHDAAAFCSEHFVPRELKPAWDTLTRDLLAAIEALFGDVEHLSWIRVHGDCHPGNLLWRDDKPNFIDLDDTRLAPAVQDIFMLLSGEREEQMQQLSEVLEGYEAFRELDARELRLVEALRALRMLAFGAWIGRRWDDPAFPKAFPWFAEERFWSEHILDLRGQMAALNEPPLQRV